MTRRGVQIRGDIDQLLKVAWSGAPDNATNRFIEVVLHVLCFQRFHDHLLESAILHQMPPRFYW